MSVVSWEVLNYEIKNIYHHIDIYGLQQDIHEYTYPRKYLSSLVSTNLNKSAIFMTYHRVCN